MNGCKLFLELLIKIYFLICHPTTVVSRATLQKHLNSPFNGHVYDLDCFTITDPEIRKVGEQARKLWRQKEIEKAEKCNLDVVTKKGLFS